MKSALAHILSINHIVPIACASLALAIPTVRGERLVSESSPQWAATYDPPFTLPTEVKKGSQLRKSLFDQLRPKVSAVVGGKKVMFEGSLKAYRNWAFFSGSTVDAKGASIPIGSSENDDTVGLWIRTIDGWRLVDFSAGHSDVFYVVWPEQYGVPSLLLGF